MNEPPRIAKRLSEKGSDPLVQQCNLHSISRGLTPFQTASNAELPLAQVLQADEACCRFEAAWKAGQRPRIEDYLGDVPEPGRSALLTELIALEIAYRRQASTRPEAEKGEVDQIVVLGRYRITGKLGEGGFGVVHKGYDDELRREVAIKVPHRHRVSQPEDIEAFLAEARVLASLDHPHIVPVFDVGRTEDGLCFVVFKFIEGSDLKAKIKEARPSCAESAELLAVVALALHHAHRKGLVHRDVKPGNILLDRSGKPHVADFGLALTEEDFGSGSSFAGTPAYMSPEQASGEGHRVDGRSDIFSLGVVFYELLSGQRPFRGRTRDELLEQIKSLEVRPPRQIEDTIPPELERICLTALAKRASERYPTALDLADDLRHWQAGDQIRESVHVQAVSQPTVNVQVSVPPVPATPPAADLSTPPRPLKIVPKGLRSFDANDADFFLELVPGPRDREGLPESIRFWKTRIEETDADKTFTVGLIYGPSGSGKSSLVKAGLLPRLAKAVTAVYVEATAKETEIRLLKGLRKHCPNLPVDRRLSETLAALRRGRGTAGGTKLLIVLDQFEQWLHARRGEENSELIHALRQCDSERVQCVVLVRDDFWMAATRFMQALEVPLLEGHNSAAVDLFHLRHAKKVLAAFGRAFGALPEREKDLRTDQEAFLDQAVAGLAQEGKVISVRLALFAEMVKGKPWTPATLRDMGGMEGVGVTFLEDAFAASTAPPPHRLHQKAAQAVLKTLLPETGTDIKGNMRSRQELLQASGYGNRLRDFEELLHILDSELRLLTPAEPAGPGTESEPAAGAGEQYYQLTHDYLVPAMRAWLTRKQKETRRGRAELLLADRAAVWNARPENPQVPSLLQWWQIRWLTQKKNWTPPQRKMMRRGSRYHAVRGLSAALLLLLATFLGLNIRDRVVEASNATHAAGLVQALLKADTLQVPEIVAAMEGYRNWTDPRLREEFGKAEPDSRQQLHASLALLPTDPTQVRYLYRRLLEAEPHEVPVIRTDLVAHQSELVDRLWTVVEKPEKGKEKQRLRGAAALAKYDPDSRRWDKVRDPVANDLVSVPAVFLAAWLESFRPVRAKLMASLAVVYRDGKRRETERSLATDLLADYAADQPQLLADLLMDADDKQFAIMYPKFKEQGEQGLSVLTGEVDRKLPADAKDDDKEKLAKRQANAAVARLRMNQPAKVWPLLQHSSDPRARSYLIDRLGALGVDAGAIIKRLDEEPDVTIRRALLLSLGEYGENELSPEARKAVLPKVKDLYRTADDPGLHAAAEWLLRTWQQESWLKEVNDEWARDKEQREKRLESIRQAVEKDKEKTAPHWYVNSQGRTMVVIPGPVEFLMGSPSTEEGRLATELPHKRRIGRTFALAAKAVTVKEFRRFLREKKLEAWFEAGGEHALIMKKYSTDENGPIIMVDWYTAATYCNWLSEQQGLAPEQWCYETNARQLSNETVCACAMLVLPHHPLGRVGAAPSASLFLRDRQPQVTALKKNYLRLPGYRLPTEAEWEYACRAGAVTSRYYGETEELLSRYGWYNKNAGERSWPVGSKKPNDLGLFDMHGNVWNWCQEMRKNYPQANEKAYDDIEDILSINSEKERVFRGGAFDSAAGDVRSARRTGVLPAARYNSVGFRAARTFTTE